MIGSKTLCMSRLGRALLSADKEESCYHTVCVGRLGGEGGGGGRGATRGGVVVLKSNTNLNKNNHSSKIESQRGGTSEAI